MAASSSIAFVFPGQGAQFVGMGKDIFETFPAAKTVFETADAVLGLAISQLSFIGPEEQLRQTINAQPAIVTLSLAIALGNIPLWQRLALCRSPKLSGLPANAAS
jgi:[acyl-carrier-protein] S-malonyltransferase